LRTADTTSFPIRAKIRAALEAAGIEFTKEGPEVKLRRDDAP